MGQDLVQQGRIDRRPDPLFGGWARDLAGIEFPEDRAARRGQVRARRRVLHVGHRHGYAQVQPWRRGGVDDLDRAVAAEPACRLAQRSDGCGQTDALRVGAARGLRQQRQPLQRQRQVRAALGRRQRVDLVDDDAAYRAQVLRRPRAQQQIQRLRRRHQDLGRLLQLLLALARRRIAGADRHPRQRERLAHGRRRLRDAGQRRAQVALDVVDERLQWGDIEDLDACCRGSAEGRGPRAEGVGFARRCVGVDVGCFSWSAHQAVDRPQECGQRLAAAGRRRDQHMPAGGDDRPAGGLGRGRAVEVLLKPAAGGGAEAIHRWKIGARL